MSTRRKASSNTPTNSTSQDNLNSINNNISNSNNDDVEPIDEQEQEQIIKDLQRQCLTQTRKMGTFLTYVCFIAGAVSLSSLLFHEYQGVHYSFYPLYVAFLHASAGCIANDMVVIAKNLHVGQESQKGNEGLDVSDLFGNGKMSVWSGKLVSRLGVVASNAPMLWHMGIVQTTDIWVWILAGSNIYTFMAVVYMKQDCLKTFAQLYDLKDSTYKHKNL